MNAESNRSSGGLFWILTAPGTAALTLVVVNMFLVSGNRTIQNEVNGRQQYINQSIQLSRVNEYLARALAVAAASRTAQLGASGNANAQRIIDDLRRQGVNINPSQPAPPPR